MRRIIVTQEPKGLRPPHGRRVAGPQLPVTNMALTPDGAWPDGVWLQAKPAPDGRAAA